MITAGDVQNNLSVFLYSLIDTSKFLKQEWMLESAYRHPLLFPKGKHIPPN